MAGFANTLENQKNEYNLTKARFEIELKRIASKVKAEEADAVSRKARFEFEMSELEAGKELAKVESTALRSEVDTVTKQLDEAKARRERNEIKSREIAGLLDQNFKRNQDVEQSITAKTGVLADIAARLTKNENELQSVELAIPARTAVLKDLEQACSQTESKVSGLKLLLVDLELKTAQLLGDVRKFEVDRIEALNGAALATRECQESEKSFSELKQTLDTDIKERKANHAAVIETMTAEIIARRANIKGEITEVRNVAAKAILKARGRVTVAREKVLTAAQLISESIVLDAKKVASVLVAEGEAEKKQCLIDAKEVVKNAVADASAVMLQTKHDKFEVEEIIVGLRRAAAASIVRSRNNFRLRKNEVLKKVESAAAAIQAATVEDSKRIVGLAVKDAEKIQTDARSLGETVLREMTNRGAALLRDATVEVENKRVNAEAEGKELLAKINREIEGDVLAAREKRKSAEEIFDAAKAASEKLVNEATEEARSIAEIASKQADTLTGRVQSDYDNKIAEADRLAGKTIGDAEAKALAITQSVQVDYDARLGEAEKTYVVRLAEAKKIVRQMQADAEAKVKAMMDDINRSSVEALADAKKIRSTATSEAEKTTLDARTRADLIIEATENDRRVKAAELERIFAQSHGQLQADLQKKKDDADSILKEWLSTENRKAKETRKQRANDAASIVRRMVEARATKSVVTPGNPFELASIADEIEQSVKQILLDENITDKDKLARFMSVDGSAKMKQKIYRRKMFQMAGIAVVVGILIASIGFALYNKVKFSKNSPNAGEIYAAKVLNKKATVRMYADQQSSSYKRSYVENILLTKDYADHEVDRKYQDRWIIDLNKFLVRELDVSDKVLVKIVPLEANMVRRLEKLARKMTVANEKEIRKDMDRIENEVSAEMSEMLGGDKKLREFLKFKKKFYETHADG